ncbi:MAG: acyl-ACP--UDP-N-acetylglucosamine O-acyltransferase [Gammaproteobacteria bacterium]|nr:acyl-ACP--UDP-N-acetylglucosamine O-acyltransferase [Gammaproteobacteria bacterium]MCP5458106.1 acyl-ACP--UDP-N-acetylglucosamine O-acyltransferase [Gammaproteobacteria bacterium]
MIHPTAVIHPETSLGANVSIGAYAVIGAQVSIGDGCSIGHHAVIEGPTTLGRDNRIYPHACLGQDAQDLGHAAPNARLEIGSGNIVREFVTMHRASAKDQRITRIGDNNLFMNYVHIAHDCVVGHHVVLANGVTLAGHVSIGDHVNMGGLCAIHQFSRIGSYAMVGGGSIITLDIPPFMLAVGNRAKLYGINRVGLRRHGFSLDEINQLKQAYRLLFRGPHRFDDAQATLQAAGLDSPQVSHLLDFIRTTKRGITF